MKDNTDKENSSQRLVVEQLAKWLDTEGYPTEFRSANSFRRHGFHAVQGHYVSNEKIDTKREIDVVASHTVSTDFGFFRLSYIIECKWSLDKPWIIFTSDTNRMMPSAIIAQTIGSKLGTALMWAVAGDESLTTLSTFSTPKRGGFSGRQAFSSGKDYFYSAVQAVIANASCYVSEYDNDDREPGVMPEACVIALPIIVVDGDLFETYFDEEANKLSIEPKDYIRCHWHGSPAWNFLATLDIVSLRHLDAFIAGRTKELGSLILTLMSTLQQIELFRRCGRKDVLNITRSSRGVRGVPPLLAEFFSLNAANIKET